MGISKQREQELVRKVSKDGTYLKRIKKNQTEAICLAAIKNNPFAIEYVNELTPTIIETAIQLNGCTLKHVPIHLRTIEVCLKAVKTNPFALRYIENPSEKLCKAAIKRNGYALEYIKNQTKELCLEAVKNQPYAYDFINKQLLTPDFIQEVIQANPIALHRIKSPQSERIYFEAVKSNGESCFAIPKSLISEKILLEAIKETGKAIKLIETNNQSPNLEEWVLTALLTSDNAIFHCDTLKLPLPIWYETQMRSHILSQQIPSSYRKDRYHIRIGEKNDNDSIYTQTTQFLEQQLSKPLKEEDFLISSPFLY